MAITFRNAASANTSSVAITTPQFGDLILVFAFNNSATTVPTVPAGFTSITSNTTTLCAGIVGYKFSAGNETTSGTWTNATNVVCMVYRGVGKIGAFASGVGNSASILYPAVTLQKSNTTSWVAAGAIEKSATAGMNGTASPLTSNRTNQTTVNGLDTNGAVASFAGATLTVTTSGRFVALSVELIDLGMSGETLSMNEGGKVQLRGGSVDFNLLDALVGGNTNTAATGTVSSEQMAQVDEFIFTDPLHAAFIRMVDEAYANWNDADNLVLGINLAFTDTLTMSDSESQQLIIVLAEALSDQMVMADKPLTSSLEIGLNIICPEFGGLWYDDLQFVNAPANILISDQLTLTDALVLGYGEIISDTLIMSDSEVSLLGIAEIFFDTLTMSDLLRFGYGEAIADINGYFIFTGLTPVLDNGQRADENPLSDGGQWSSSLLNGSHPLQLVSNQIVVTVSSASNSSYWSAQTFGPDLEAYVTVATSSGPFTIYARTSNEGSSSLNAYAFDYNSTTNTLTLHKIVNGFAPVAISPIITRVVNSGDSFGISVIGNTISGWHKPSGGQWKLVVSANDSAINGPGHIGLFAQVSATAFTNFGGGTALPASRFVDDLQFVLGSSNILVSDQLPYTTVPGNWASFETFEFALAGGTSSELLSKADSTGFNWFDLLAFTLTTGGALTELLSDTLTMSDALGLGYGEGNVDQLVFSDSNALGYGDLISDSLTLSDSDVVALGFVETLSDTLTMSDSEILGYGNSTVDSLTFSDSNSIGYGDQISEAMSLSDSLIIGYGQAEVDSLTFSDSSSIGYGDAISDALTLSDSDIVVLGIAEILSDTLTMSDSLAVGYGNAITDHLTLSDSETIGYGNSTVDSLTFLDSNAVGYGDLISDIMTLSDFMAAQLSIAESFSDQLVFSDTSNLGYGDAITDTLTMSDSEVLVFGLNENIAETLTLSDSSAVGYGFAITDTLTMSDSLAELLSIAEVLSDTLTMSDSLGIGYGQGQVDSLTFSDSTSVGYGDLISDALTLTDSEQNVLGINELFTDQLVMSDSERNVLGINESFSDQLTMADFMAALMSIAGTFSDQIVMSDSNLLGYGDAITDSLTLSEALVIGYGQANVDSLTFSDSMSVGYGDSISDQMTQSDSEIIVLGLTELISETLTLSDAMALGYGLGIAEQLSLSDSETIGYGNATVDSLVFLDSNAVGYGDLIADQMVLSDSTAEQLSIAETFSDTISFSDSEIIGYGNATVDSLTFLDTNAVGYGDLIADQMTMADAFLFNAGGGILEQFSDSLTMSDSEAIGYGNATVDSLTFLDSNAVGYGDVIADSMTLSDSFTELFSIAEMLADQLSMSDSVAAGYGNATSDQLILSDALAAGYGQGQVDALTFSDSSSLGYGDLIADQLTLTDSEQNVLGITELLSSTLSMSDSLELGYGQGQVDSLTFSDSSSVGYGDLISDVLSLSDSLTVGYGQANVDSLTFSDSSQVGYGDLISDTLVFVDSYVDLLAGALGLSDQLTLSDSDALGIGNIISETLTIVDYPALGYGFLISDFGFNWLDSFVFTTGQPAITLNLSDAVSFSDQLGAGYGNEVSEQNTMADTTAFMEGMNVLLADATPAMLEAFQAILSFGLQVSEVIAFQEQLQLMYGLLIADSESLSDQLAAQLIGPYSLALADSETAAWLEAVLAEMVFAPGEIIAQNIFALNELVADINVTGQVQANAIIAVNQGSGGVSSETQIDADIAAEVQG